MFNQTIATLKQGLSSKSFSSVELTQHYLNRITQFDTELNSFITVCEASALKQAKQADKLIQSGNASAITGIPIAQKDIFCTQDIKTTCASKMLANFIAPYNATVIDRFNSAGAIMIGKTNMDEFAMGSTTENSHFGPTLNPWNFSCIPGGSSGGSAAAVAARLVPAATGTDTGGSIRQPAAMCGITGLKPTYGRVSRWGMIAFASSLDQGGILAQTVEDTALLLQVIAGHDEKDSTSVDIPVDDYMAAISTLPEPMTIGLPTEYFSTALDERIKIALETQIKLFEKQGHRFKKISLPHTELAKSTYYVIAPAECSSNLARYDGVRYGHRCDNPSSLLDLYQRSRNEGFGDEVKRRILIGTYVLSSGYYDAYYRKAQQMRRLIRDDFINAFKEVDLILAPTAPDIAFSLDAKKNNPVEMYQSDIFTIAINLAGLPALSIPIGFTNHLPIGGQLIAPHFGESSLLSVGHQYQQHANPPNVDVAPSPPEPQVKILPFGSEY